MPDIHHQLKINVPAAQVFDALTQPAGLDSWWTLHSTGSPARGEIYRLYFGPEYDWQAEVVHVVPKTELTWQVVRAMDDWQPTSFGFTLSESTGQTKLRFFHRDWESASDHFAITNYCWAQLLHGLKDYVETGSVVPFPERS